MKLLIPGGAGYIGSHTVKNALKKGYDVTILDNFSTGHRWATQDCEILEVDLLDKEKLSKLLKGRKFDAVIHFAAKSLVAESFKSPEKYYKNNILGTINLVEEILKNDINKLVFSSSAAIYGNPSSEKISEVHPKKPINPYGRSKLYTENILEDFTKSNELKVICLRYFNAAGADPSGDIGEDHDPETHLIPNILNSVIHNKIVLEVFGDDYPTYDGTCIRDYIHVNDLAEAHILGIEKIDKLKDFSALNLGNGNGFSIIEIIKSVERVINTPVSYKVSQRRKGDPAVLVADNSLSKKELGWQPDYESMDKIIETAYKWHMSLR
tara:strand:+ start:6175 stop:7146 length:972 start_codon:yes stop_codon:yes gene_type:complete